jgi:hypothetical protein
MSKARSQQRSEERQSGRATKKTAEILKISAVCRLVRANARLLRSGT